MADQKVPGKVLAQEELEKLAKELLNEDPKRREADIKHIRDWINKQPHLGKNVRQDDTFILFFLRGCKFSLEKVKKKIEAWNTLRGMCPEFFDNWDPQDPFNAAILKKGITVVLPGYDKHGRKVILQRLSLVDPSKYSPETVQRVVYMTMESGMQDTTDFQASVCGAVVISDAVGSTMAHMKNFSPTMSKKMITIFEEAYPSRPKEMHILNMPGFVDSVFNMIKGFMKEKMRQRMQIHKKGDYSKLQEALGTEVLPIEYGGTNGSIDDIAAETEKRVQAAREWLIAQTKLKADESKRIAGTSRDYSDMFGMVGSFRQLDFD